LRGLSFSVWWLRHHTLHISPYSLPYTEVSPLTYLKREFKTIDDIWDEIEKIAEVNYNTSRSIGQDLFHLIPLFTNPNYMVDEWHIEMINEYNLMKNFNISLGVLDDVSSDRLNCFSIIQNEVNAIAEYERVKNNGK
jgi:hypothetical protein